MAVYVGPLFTCIPNKKWQYRQVCHLFVDVNTDFEELHAIAHKLGLKRSWFQCVVYLDDSKISSFFYTLKIPHYDLTASKREKAIYLERVIPVDTRIEVKHIEIWRKQNDPTKKLSTYI